MKAALYGFVMAIISSTTLVLLTSHHHRAVSFFIRSSRSASSSIFVRGFQITKTATAAVPNRHRHFYTTMERPSTSASHRVGKKRTIDSLQSSASASDTNDAIAIPAPNNETGTDKDEPRSAPLHLVEGILAVDKPIDWTSQDVVSYIRRIIERDARDRGANPAKMGRKNKSQQIKVGHGGTLDPLATGVLVVGVGRGTKELSKYLHGSKAYRATGRFGIETTTLDLDPKANITQTKPWDHVSFDKIDETLPKFVGKIQQIPPVFSAKRQGGKKAYEIAREEGVDSVKMEAREVEIYRLKLLRAEPQQQQGVGGESSTGQVDDAPSASTKSSKPTLDPISSELPDFTIEMECGGGTFVRSLIRDVAYELDTVATTALLQRTKQGPFVLDDCLPKDDWTAENIYEQIRNWNDKLKDDEEEDGTIEQ